MKKSIFPLLFIALAACQNQQPKPVIGVMPVEKQDTTPKIAIREDQLALTKDPVCGMPAFKFLKDTTQFEGNIYGFCSKECKSKFKESPAEYLKKFKKS